jgi:hypothetical protein
MVKSALTRASREPVDLEPDPVIDLLGNASRVVLRRAMVNGHVCTRDVVQKAD